MNKDKVLFCLEVDRSGLPEEDMVIHNRFDKDVTRKEIVEFLTNEDIGWQDNYCDVNYYIVYE